MAFLSACLINGYHQADEIGQITAFSLYKLGIEPAELLPWEFGARMRSWFVPTIYYPLIKLVNTVLGGYRYLVVERVMLLFDAFLWLLLLPVLNKLLALPEYLRSSDKKQRLLLLCCGLWWFMPSMVVRHSSEAIGLMLLLLYLYFHKRDAEEPGYITRPRAFLVGIIAAFSFWARFQNAFFIAGFWICQAVSEVLHDRRISLKSWLIAAGVIFGILLGIGLDSYNYGCLTISFYNYFTENVVKDLASVFGRSSVFYYFYQTMGVTVNPFLLAWVPLAMVLSWKNQYLRNVTVGFALFFMAHVMVPHKEIRFILPMVIPVLLLLLALFAKKPWENFLPRKWQWLFHEHYLKFVIICNIVMLVIYSAFGLSNNRQRAERALFAIPHQENERVKVLSYNDFFGYFDEEFTVYPVNKITFTRWGHPFSKPEWVDFVYADIKAVNIACKAYPEAYVLLSRADMGRVDFNGKLRQLVDYPFESTIAAYPPQWTLKHNYLWLRQSWWKRMWRYQIIKCEDYLENAPADIHSFAP